MILENGLLDKLRVLGTNNLLAIDKVGKGMFSTLL